MSLGWNGLVVLKLGQVTMYLPVSCSGRMDNSGSYADINSNVCLSVSCTDMPLGWNGLRVLKLERYNNCELNGQG